MVTASCHCGAVRFEIAAAPSTVTDCNCTLCRRLGTLWAYYHPSQVTLLAAPDATVPYIQGDRTLATHHCAQCGCTTHWQGLDAKLDRMAVNARLMEPDVLAAARIRKLDGFATWLYIDE